MSGHHLVHAASSRASLHAIVSEIRSGIMADGACSGSERAYALQNLEQAEARMTCAPPNYARAIADCTRALAEAVSAYRDFRTVAESQPGM